MFGLFRVKHSREGLDNATHVASKIADGNMITIRITITLTMLTVLGKGSRFFFYFFLVVFYH